MKKCEHTFPKLSVHLPSEDMEKVGRRSHVGDLHVAVLVLAIKLVRRREYSRIFVAELEISFHPARRMLWTLSIIAMR